MYTGQLPRGIGRHRYVGFWRVGTRSFRFTCPRLRIRCILVLVLPDDEARWLDQSLEELVLRECAYWVSLRDAKRPLRPRACGSPSRARRSSRCRRWLGSTGWDWLPKGSSERFKSFTSRRPFLGSPVSSPPVSSPPLSAAKATGFDSSIPSSPDSSASVQTTFDSTASASRSVRRQANVPQLLCPERLVINGCLGAKFLANSWKRPRHFGLL